MSLNAAQKLYQSGNLDQAAALCRALSAGAPRDHRALNLLAMIAIKQRDYTQGIAYLDQSLAALPGQATALFNRGYAKSQLRRFAAAIEDLSQAVSIRSGYARAHFVLGKALAALGGLDEAIAEYDAAIRFEPDHAKAFNNKANLLKRQDSIAEALACYDEAIRLRPAFAEAHNNRGKALKDLGDFTEALAAYDRAIALRPDYATALTNKALLLLMLGRMSSGWALFEWRWQSSRADKRREFSQPLWIGRESIAGRRLLIWAEQGFGDLIQFSRFLPLVEKLGCKPLIEAPASLMPLLETLDGAFEIVGKGQSTLPDFDCHCPLMSLPLALQITLESIPAPAAFRVPAECRAKWRGMLGEKTAYRIGLAWSGSPTHGNDHNRSLPLQGLAPLLSCPVEFHSVQKEFRAEDALVLAGTAIRRHDLEIGDFADTAALIDELDLVISVDTSVAHLAASLGKETWILLPFVPDYRWLLEREDTPWYPTVRLFRQPARNDWLAPLSAMVEALTQRLAPARPVDPSP